MGDPCVAMETTDFTTMESDGWDTSSFDLTYFGYTHSLLGKEEECEVQLSEPMDADEAEEQAIVKQYKYILKERKEAEARSAQPDVSVVEEEGAIPATWKRNPKVLSPEA